MIFDRKISAGYTEEEKGGGRLSLSLSFREGDEDFHEVDCTDIVQDGDRMLVERVRHICSDSYRSRSTFGTEDFPELVRRLRKEGIHRIYAILTSLPSYVAGRSGKAEDFRDEEDAVGECGE